MLCKAKVAVSCAIRTYLLTYSIVQSPSWEANWFAASQEIPAFHGTPRFITTLTSVRHQSLSWASPIQSIYPHPTSWRSILILSTHLSLGLPSGLLPSGFPTKTLYTPLSSPIRATCPAHLILLDFNTTYISVNSVTAWKLSRRWSEQVHFIVYGFSRKSHISDAAQHISSFSITATFMIV